MALNFSFSKKGDATPVLAPVWHPDFRNAERLPDTKVVRTTFFVNTAAIAAVLALLLWVGYREIELRGLQEQIAAAETQIAGNKTQSGEALRLSKVFIDEQKRLSEVQSFSQLTIGPTEFIALLAETLPPEISIEMVDMRFAETPAGGGFQMRALIAGSPDQASGTASRYVDTLRANPRLAAVFDPITLTNLNRDTSGGFMSVDIAFKNKAAGEEAKAK